MFKSFEFKMNKETTTQNKPAIATVVNLGVFFFHLNVTEKIEKPTAEASPNNNPVKDPKDTLPKAIIATPIEATTIDIQTPNEICSFKKRKPNNAVMKGIAAKHKRVIAALVLVIDQMKVIIAVPSPIPPSTPDNPILK
jgi:hypothetical protein